MGEQRAAFGEAGQIVPQGSVKFGYTTGNGDRSDIAIEPGALYFIMDNLAVGGSVTLDRVGVSGGSTTTVGIAPTAAYNLPLVDKLTLFPQAALVLVHTSIADTSGTVIALSAFAPVLYHVTSHFFLGAGPLLSFDLIVPSGMSHSFVIELETTIGGYFSL